METSNSPTNGNGEQDTSSTSNVASESHNHGDGGRLNSESSGSTTGEYENGGTKNGAEEAQHSSSSSIPDGNDDGSSVCPEKQKIEVGSTVPNAGDLSKKEEEGKCADTSSLLTGAKEDHDPEPEGAEEAQHSSSSSTPDGNDDGSSVCPEKQKMDDGSTVPNAGDLSKKEEEGKCADTSSLLTGAKEDHDSEPEGLGSGKQETLAESSVSHAEPHSEEEKDIKDSEKEDSEGDVHSLSTRAETKLQDVSKPKDLFKHPFVILAVAVALLAVFVGWWLYQSPSPEPQVKGSIDVFRSEFKNVESRFPSQRAELWKRSKIHLERHLQTAQPTEPVSIILTSGRMAERTLRCLASHMAAAFSLAHNASVLHIDGVSEAHLDSDQAKLDIDEKLRGAFEGNKDTAVIHRFEELPPGSTLIFYRYCDHENAAYKNVFLVFTVLVEEEELRSHLSLSDVEEIVQDHIQDKFLSSAQPASFDKMDIDKLSGLWSRISHLILPVASEKQIEQQGCRI